jgi:hypothetical protein
MWTFNFENMNLQTVSVTMNFEVRDMGLGRDTSPWCGTYLCQFDLKPFNGWQSGHKCYVSGDVQTTSVKYKRKPISLLLMFEDVSTNSSVVLSSVCNISVTPCFLSRGLYRMSSIVCLKFGIGHSSFILSRVYKYK